jgi:hypothetical protein
MTNQMRGAWGKGLITISVAAVAALALIVPGSGQGAAKAVASGDIIVADSLHKAIKAVDPVTGAASTVSINGSFELPTDVAFADDGDILVAERDGDAFVNKGGIIRVDPDTGTQTTVSSNAVSDAAGGKQLFSNPIALDRKDDKLFVTDFAPTSQGGDKVIKVDIETGKQSLVAKKGELGFPGGIVAAGVAKPLVSDEGAYNKGGIIEVNPNSGKQTKVSANGKFRSPQMLALFGSNSVLVTNVDQYQVPGRIIEVDLQSGDQEIVSAGGIDQPGGIAVIDDDTAVVGDYLSPITDGGLYRVDLDTGNQTPLNVTDLKNPLGMRVAP